MTMGRDGNRAKWERAKWEAGEMAKGRNGNVIWAKWERAKWERAKWEDTIFEGLKLSQNIHNKLHFECFSPARSYNQ
jgi:hypothetical protein